MNARVFEAYRRSRLKSPPAVERFSSFVLPVAGGVFCLEPDTTRLEISLLLAGCSRGKESECDRSRCRVRRPAVETSQVSRRVGVQGVERSCEEGELSSKTHWRSVKWLFLI